MNREFPGSPVVGDSGLSLLRAQVGFLVGELRSQKLHGTAKANKQNIPNNLKRLLRYSLFQVHITVYFTFSNQTTYLNRLNGDAYTVRIQLFPLKLSQTLKKFVNEKKQCDFFHKIFYWKIAISCTNI